MLSMVVLLKAGLPAFAPAPVFRNPTVTGSMGVIHMKQATMAVKCGGRESVFKLARDAKFTFNGEEGYSYDDMIPPFISGDESAARPSCPAPRGSRRA